MIHPLINYTIPMLIVFDLDFTLWPFEAGNKSDLWYPFQRTIHGMTDCHNKSIRIFPDVKRIFEELEEEKVWIGVTSNNSYSEANQDLLYLWLLDEHITFKEIEPDTMINKFSRIHEKSGVNYTQMLLYDDEPKNVLDVAELGVLGTVVEHGLNMEAFRNGIDLWRENKRIRNEASTPIPA